MCRPNGMCIKIYCTSFLLLDITRNEHEMSPICGIGL